MPLTLTKIFVSRMLTRDLFAVANLLAEFNSKKCDNIGLHLRKL